MFPCRRSYIFVRCFRENSSLFLPIIILITSFFLLSFSHVAPLLFCRIVLAQLWHNPKTLSVTRNTTIIAIVSSIEKIYYREKNVTLGCVSCVCYRFEVVQRLCQHKKPPRETLFPRLCRQRILSHLQSSSKNVLSVMPTYARDRPPSSFRN